MVAIFKNVTFVSDSQNNWWKQNKNQRMLRPKWAWYTCEIIKDWSCVKQNVEKQNMEARNNYLLGKKGTKKKSKYRGRPSIPDSSHKKVRKLKKTKLESINNSLT